MNVYVLTNGEYSSTTIVGIFATLEAAKSRIPLASWTSGDDPWYAQTDDGREWHTDHWWHPSIHKRELRGAYAVDALLHAHDTGPMLDPPPYADEVPAPPPPPKCKYREVLEEGPGFRRSLDCQLDEHDGDDHVLREVTGYFTTDNFIFGPTFT